MHAFVMGREGGVLGGPISMTSFGNCLVVGLGQWRLSESVGGLAPQ